jgi:hypothetical protein
VRAEDAGVRATSSANRSKISILVFALNAPLFASTVTETRRVEHAILIATSYFAAINKIAAESVFDGRVRRRAQRARDRAHAPGDAVPGSRGALGELPRVSRA